MAGDAAKKMALSLVEEGQLKMVRMVYLSVVGRLKSTESLLTYRAS